MMRLPTRIAVLKEDECNGQGAVTIDGKMIDYANIRMIQRLQNFKDAV
jgi:malyl-CoA/(S)-citramalyl-CoA lyase